MHIGVASPITLQMLAAHLPDQDLPRGYPFPLIAQYVNQLLAEGHRVTVFTLCRDTARPRFIAGERLAVAVVPWRRHRWWLDLQRREIQGLAAAMRAHPVEVLHAFWTYEFARAAQQTGIPALVTAQDSPYRMLRMMAASAGVFLRLSRTHHARQVLRVAQRLSAPSPYLADELRRDFAPPAGVLMIPNGLAAADWIAAPRPARDPGKVPVLLASFSGAFHGRKNGPVLLEACQLLAAQGVAFRLVLVGADCEPGGKAAAWLAAHGGPPAPTLLGPRPHAELLDLVEREADLVVHPSLEEAFGMAVLEAMAKGAPVIAGAHSGAVPWLLENGLCGYLADVRSAEPLAATLRQAILDPARSARQAARAWARSRAGFSLPAITRQYLKVLDELRQEPGEPAAGRLRRG